MLARDPDVRGEEINSPVLGHYRSALHYLVLSVPVPDE
jgi:hypothetical protein